MLAPGLSDRSCPLEAEVNLQPDTPKPWTPTNLSINGGRKKKKKEKKKTEKKKKEKKKKEKKKKEKKKKDNNKMKTKS